MKISGVILIKLAYFVLLAPVVISIVVAPSSAQTLAGTLTNATANKPAAGDSIELINIANGMDVAATTKADSAGKFSFKLDAASGAGGPHLIRATHQGVTYFQFAPPGTSNVDLKVYDVSKKVEGISLTADVMRFQADKTSLQGMRLFAVDNNSSPAITQMSDRSFEFYLPAGAKVEQLQAKAPNGQPIPAEAVPQSEKGRFAIAFPLRPGETQFQLEFTMPYNGTVKIDPKPLYPAEHFVVVLPKSMHFAATDSSTFKSMQDPNQADSVVQVVQQTHVGQQLGFTVTGTGTISEHPQAASGGMGGGGMGGGGGQPGQAEEQSQAGPDNRPGGGLGAPIDAPDPLEKYRWPIIGAFVVLLGIGGWIVTKRQGGLSAASGGGAAMGARGPLAAPITGPGAGAISGSARISPATSVSTAPDAQRLAPPAAPASKSGALLEVLKEELFQLEVERKQGKITQADYEKAKAALDQTLDRALKRQS